MTGRPLYGIDLGRRAAELYEGGHGRDAIALRGSCAARQSQFPSPLMRRGSALSIDGSILFCQFFRIPWTFLRVYRDGFGCHGLILGVSSSFSYRTKRAVLNVLQKRLEIAIANFFIGMHNPGKSQKRPRTVSFLAGELVECAHALRRRNSNLTQPALCLV